MLQRRVLGAGVGLGDFFNRQRLARHGRLRDKQIARTQYPAVRRHHVACRQRHHVARHQRPYGQLVGLPLANHGGSVADHGLEAVGGAPRTPLLYKTDAGAQGHHYGNHGSALGVARGERHGGQRGEQQVKRVFVANPQVQPRGERLLVVYLIGAVAG